MDDSVGTITKHKKYVGIDNKLRQTNGSTTSYFLADHLGSTNGLTNASGAVTASNSYDSFGNPSNLTFPTRYQFTGREFDNFSGLQYSRARFYDPKLGRFISEDPIGIGGGDVNLYVYVRNSSLRQIDPLGTFGLCKQPDGTVRPCGPRDLARVLGMWNPWVSVDFEGSGHFLTAGGTVSTGFVYNPLTCELCQTSKICVNRGGGGFIGVGPQIGLQFGPYRGADKINVFEEESDITIEGGEGLGLGISGTATKNGLAIGIKPELAAGAYVGSNLCIGTTTHCYFTP